MLLTLSIRNIVLIDSADISFNSGFCVLTGETGAGKSILLDALGLALGKRAETRLLRHGEKQGSVTVEFNVNGSKDIEKILRGHGIAYENNLLLRRVLYSDGKSKAFINDEPVSINLLQVLSEYLVEIHGQHDQRGLLSSSTHGSALDEFGRLQKELKKVSESYYGWKKAEEEFQRIKNKAEKAKEEEEYLRHVLDELQKLSPQSGEEEELADKRKILIDSEKIMEALNAATEELVGRDASGIVASSSRLLERSTIKSGDIFVSAVEALDRALAEINNAISAMESIANNINVDERTIDDIEERLFALRAASRKYNRPVYELLLYEKEVVEQLSLLENQEAQLESLAKLVEEKKTEYIKNATDLTEKRKKCAAKLEKNLIAELKPLKMANARFKIQIETQPEEKWNASGQDKIGFMVSTNQGSPFGPLGKIASGGELSRFMLALKVVLSGTKSVPVMIFDEIDTGIGGAVADAVGKRLAMLSAAGAQVLCVTHQPQVASHGTYHIRVDKKDKSNNTTVCIDVLCEQERREEVARMLAGAEISEEARAAAGKLMGSSNG